MATSYANNSGTGARQREMVVTTDITTSVSDGGTDWSVLLDGDTSTATASHSRQAGSGNNGNDRKLQFDWGPGAEGGIVIDEFKIYFSSTTTFGTYSWQGSDDGSSWTTIGATLTLGGSSGVNTYTRANSTGYRYYRLHTTSFSNGGGSSAWWEEIEFKIEDTIPQASRPSWFNTGGFGNRSSFITVTTDAGISTGVVQNLVDGDYAGNSSHAFTFSGGQTGKYVRFDFGSGASVIVDTIIWYQSGTATHGTCKVQGSNNGSSWTDIGSSFTLGGATISYIQLGGNTTGYRYYQILNTSGNNNGVPFIEEAEFRVQGIVGLAKTFKLSGYGVITPVTARANKLSGYGVIMPVQARAMKLSGYAVITPTASGNRQPVLITAIGGE